MAEEFRQSVSVIILDNSDEEATTECIRQVTRSDGHYVNEILVIGSGMLPATTHMGGPDPGGHVRRIAIGAQRSHGEKSNIGAEEATGEFILILRDAVRIAPDCVGQLVLSLGPNRGMAAVGPVLLLPDGTVRSLGGVVLDSGEVRQIGSSTAHGVHQYAEPFNVDYCSAACLLVRKYAFLRVGGFSLEWESSDYSDVDLCLSLQREAGHIMVNPNARAVYLDSAAPLGGAKTAESDPEIDHIVFVEKWGGWLASDRTRPTALFLDEATGQRPDAVKEEDCTAPKTNSAARAIETAVLYSPYELVPGGGERVLLELASTLTDSLRLRRVQLASPNRYSNLRIRQLSKAFGLQTPASATTLDELREDHPDVSFVLGNELLPSIPGYGRRFNVYLCQFPFPAPEECLEERVGHLESFNEIWVYSNFVRRYVNGHLRLRGLQPPPIRVMYPPATLPRPQHLPPWRSRNAIMTVGRFFTGGHDKRQDIVIEIVKALNARLGRTVPLIVAGALHATAESRDRLRGLVSMAAGIECRFYPNVSRRRLIDLYFEAAVLVHATGYGTDALAFPERLEHFGIAPVEAASSGCIPVVYGAGGPVEVMRALHSPTVFSSIPEAVEKIAEILSDTEGSEALSQELVRSSEVFSAAAFRARVEQALTSQW